MSKRISILPVCLVLSMLLTLLCGCNGISIPPTGTRTPQQDQTEAQNFSAPTGESRTPQQEQTEPQNSSAPAGESHTPEEVAMLFVKSACENDPENFAKCVHPNMLEEWASSFHVDGEDHVNRVTEISTGQVVDVSFDDLEKINSDPDKPSNIFITAAKIVTVYLKYYDYIHSEEKSSVRECAVMQIDGCWYAFGWS